MLGEATLKPERKQNPGTSSEYAALLLPLDVHGIGQGMELQSVHQFQTVGDAVRHLSKLTALDLQPKMLTGH